MDKSKNKKILILIFLILIAASFLRLWKLDKNPPSLFGDELDVGYHALSIINTGRDYSGNFMPLEFHSLAEWRTPLYLYASVPTVKIFGITAWGVRLPAAIFGIFGVLIAFYLIKEITKSNSLALMSSLILCFSPWHIQYSRSGFEVTMLLFFIMFAFWTFFRAINTQKGKYLWISAACFALTPLIYSTAKIYTPIILIVLFLFYRKKIFNLKKSELFIGVVVLLIIGSLTVYSTLFGQGAQRFNYLSVFSDPSIEYQLGPVRDIDSDQGSAVLSKYFHNKYQIIFSKIENNFLTSLSFNFLFDKGDPNLRHTVPQMGVFYHVEIVLLFLGIYYLSKSEKHRKFGYILFIMILIGILPSSLTRDGANHATRLILILPPIVFVMSYGLWSVFKEKRNLKYLFLICYLILFVFDFLFYQHQYWFHYPIDSEKWWHYGFSQSFSEIEKIQSKYSKVFVTTYDEPPWIFFAAGMQYPPEKWQLGYPFKKQIVGGFGEVSYIDKYYFGSPNGLGIYDWGKVLGSDMLYLASAKEVNVNLIEEPDRTPKDLKLVYYIKFPSGLPAYYIFSGKNEINK